MPLQPRFSGTGGWGGEWAGGSELVRVRRGKKKNIGISEVGGIGFVEQQRCKIASFVGDDRMSLSMSARSARQKREGVNFDLRLDQGPSEGNKKEKEEEDREAVDESPQNVMQITFVRSRCIFQVVQPAREGTRFPPPCGGSARGTLIYIPVVSHAHAFGTARRKISINFPSDIFREL